MWHNRKARGQRREVAMSEETASLVADGWQRARQANRSCIEQEIRARYARQLAGADICEHLQIEVRIRAEIERALAEAAPREALY
jgi:hypothetical protein